MPNVIKKFSPNFWKGRAGYKPEAVVIHIMDGTLAGTDSHFASPATEVSAHYGIGQSGETHQYVDEADTAWHAGGVQNPSWSLLKSGVNPNRYTIGIEHEGNAGSVWSENIKQASAHRIVDICKRWNIPIDRDHIIGHYQINSVRRPNCPAHDKRIVDELVERAKAIANPPQPPKSKIPPEVEEGVKKIEEGLAQIKRAVEIWKS